AACRTSATLNMAIKTIVSKAPTRIDLAGGTVDIWPLYLFLNRPTTLNLGIDLFAETRLEQAPAASGKGVITLASDDQGTELKLGWDQLQSHGAVSPQLELPFKLLQYFAARKAEKPGEGGKRDFERYDLTIRT